MHKKAAQELLHVAKTILSADRLEQSVIRHVNEKLYHVSTHNAQTYYKKIPMTTVFDILKESGLVTLDIDGTKLQGVILTGRSGHANFDVGRDYGDKPGPALNNTSLHINWEKMEPSGNYEFLVRLT